MSNREYSSVGLGEVAVNVPAAERGASCQGLPSVIVRRAWTYFHDSSNERDGTDARFQLVTETNT